MQACYDKIRRDTRHADCEIVHSQAVRQRSFPKWAMGGRRLPADVTSKNVAKEIRSVREMDLMVRDTPLMLRQLFRLFGEFYFEGKSDQPDERREAP